jgi:NitT/TauT family transport system ATP-binding protein
MGLADVTAAYPATLSGGMQRRVALARAFVIQPRLLLLDEPFISLDAPVAAHLRDLLLLQWQRRAGTTILFVTHDLREALSLSDRVLFLSTSPAHIIRDYNVPLPRPRSPDSAAVEDMRRQLLTDHPALLSGRMEQERTV